MRIHPTALVAIRSKDGLSQLDLAGRADVSQSYLSELEKGRKADVSPAVARRLANALAVPLSAITLPPDDPS